MAITQPGGAGTTIIFDNGTYGAADYAAAFPADFIDNTNGSYRSRVSLQNGDGVSTATTAWVDTGKAIWFDAGKTYTVSSVGQANRTTQWGTKIGTSAAKDGCDILFGGTPTLRGIVNLYGSKLKSTSGFILTPGLGASPITGVGELIGNTFQWGNAGGQFGNPTSGNFSVVINNNFAAVGVNGSISNFGADTEDGSVFSGTGMGRFINSATIQLNLSRPKFLGTPSLADIHMTSNQTWNLAEPGWSQNAAPFDSIAGTVAEWWGFGACVYDSSTKAKLSGISVELMNVFGTSVVDTTTDSEGLLVYGSGVSLNRVQLRQWTNGPVAAEYGPFVLKANHKGTINPGYPSFQAVIAWPGRNYTGGRQFQNVLAEIPLVTGNPTPWVERVSV